MKVVVAMLGFVALVAGIAFTAGVLGPARYADECAEALLAGANDSDAEYLRKTVRTPGARDAILAAGWRDIGFVRPSQEATARIGVFLRSTESATTTKPLFLLLTSEEGECAFIQDYGLDPKTL